MQNTTDLYTPLPQAIAELERRRKDRVLCEKVERYFENYPPLPELKEGPRGVVARALITPIYELIFFMRAFKSVPIKTVFYEFKKDKFVGINIEKACLGHMTFFRETEAEEKTIIGSRRIIDFAKSEGKSFEEVRTLDGGSLVDFHHKIRSAYFGEASLDVHDFSEWFLHGNTFSKELPYLRYLGLFLVHGILFDNFLMSDRNKRQRDFTEKRVLPAFQELFSEFKLKPLIVPIDPVNTEDEPFWCYYPENVERLLGMDKLF